MYLLFNLHIWSSSIPKCHLIDENLRAQSFQFGTSQTIILEKNRILCPAILSSFLKRTTLLTCLPILPCLVFSSLTSSSLQLNVIILGTTDCTPTLSGSPVWAAQHLTSSASCFRNLCTNVQHYVNYGLMMYRKEVVAICTQSILC